MRVASRLLAPCTLALAGPALALTWPAPAALAEGAVLAPEAIAWAPGPASLPEGAEAAVLYGDPGQEGMFALRLKVPAGYHIPPHTHPRPEVVTVLSGAVKLGMGETADPEKAELLPAGSFFALEPATAHYVYTDEETVVQLNSVGPWALEYVNPADDPRQQ